MTKCQKHKKYPYFFGMDPASGKDYSVEIWCRKIGDEIEIIKVEYENDQMPKMQEKIP